MPSEEYFYKKFKNRNYHSLGISDSKNDSPNNQSLDKFIKIQKKKEKNLSPDI